MKKFFAVIALLMFTACAGADSLKPGMGGSTVTVSGKSYKQVWNAASKAVASSGLAITESDKKTGTIKAEKGAGLATWGEVVGVFVSPANKKSKTYTVEVKSMKRGQLQITGQDWEKTVIEGIKAELNL